MKDSLQTLSRIQKFSIDEQRKKLNEQLSVEERIVQALKNLNKQFELEKEFAREHGNVGDFGAYVKHYLEQKDSLEQALEMVRFKIEEIKDIITDMYKEQKTYEIVDDNRKKRQAKEEEHKMQQTLDEIGTNTYIKKHKS